jgi:hypothetical protein
VSKRSKEEKLSKYEKDYLERLAAKGKMKSMQREEPTISDEERTRKVQEAEKIQIKSAHQIQDASAAKIQSELDIKNKQEFLENEVRTRNKEVLSLIDELKVLKIELDKQPVKRKVTKKKASPKRKTSVKRKVTKKKASPKRKTSVKRKVTKKKASPKRRKNKRK